MSVRLPASGSWPALATAALLLAACRDDPPALDGGTDEVSIHGMSCEVVGGIDLDSDCRACVCSEAGTWDCFRTSCATRTIIEPRAELLVVVDDSSSMGPDRQARLARGMEALLAEIDAYPDPVGLRIGVTTTDTQSPACDPATADDGALLLRSCNEHLGDFAAPAGPTEVPISDNAAERGCTDVCALPELTTGPSILGEGAARPWLERYGDRTNLPEGVDFGEALACAIPQGLGGCDFESPLDATLTALERSLEPDGPNAGFLDGPGSIMVLVVTDEADCSAVEEWGTVFDPEGSRRFWSDPDADAPTSAVCWNTGVVCEGGPGVYDACTVRNIDTAENVGVPESNAVLRPLGEIERLLRDVTDDKQLIHPDATLDFTVLAGVPQGYEDGESLVYTDGQDDPAFALQYGVGPGCSNGEEVAVPPARMLSVADRVFSVCEDDYRPALAAVGRQMVERIRPNCYAGCVADVDPDAAGVQPYCAVVEVSAASDGTVVQTPVVACDGEQVPEGAELCVITRTDGDLTERCSDEGFNLEFALRRVPGSSPDPRSYVEVACQPSENRAVDCPGLP